ncbi:hypothetical protein EK904_014157, partial [Melospiza melodia maxima]
MVVAEREEAPNVAITIKIEAELKRFPRAKAVGFSSVYLAIQGWLDREREENDTLPDSHLNIVLQSLMPPSKTPSSEVRVSSSRCPLLAAPDEIFLAFPPKEIALPTAGVVLIQYSSPHCSVPQGKEDAERTGASGMTTVFQRKIRRRQGKRTRQSRLHRLKILIMPGGTAGNPLLCTLNSLRTKNKVLKYFFCLKSSPHMRRMQVPARQVGKNHCKVQAMNTAQWEIPHLWRDLGALNEGSLLYPIHDRAPDTRQDLWCLSEQCEVTWNTSEIVHILDTS